MEENRKKTISIVLALLLPFLTCWVQWQFWSIFKPFVWFLFFPTVFFSSRIGGKIAGIISTVVSTLLVVYFFIPPQLSIAAKNPNNLYSVVVFLLMGALFSYTHDRLERANRRAAEAQDAARIAKEQLQEARIGMLQAEQMQAESELLKVEDRFRRLFSRTPVPLCFITGDGVLADRNERFVQMFGYTSEDVPTIDEWWRRAYPDAEYRNRVLETWNAAVEKAAATGSDVEPIEYRVTCKDGTERTVLISGITLGDDFLATFFDVTERRLFEEALLEREHRFRSIFNYSPIAIGIGRKDNGRLVEVNDAWLQLYGFERDEVIGRTTKELNLYARADERNDFIRIINEHGQIVNHEVQLRRKSGEIICVQYSAELIKLGEESYLQVMMTDISEQKRIETELLKSEEMYRSLFENMLNGFAYCRMIFDGDSPQDFIYLSVNDAFGKQTGLEDVVGRRVTEVIPGIRESDNGLFEAYGRVAMTGNPEQFEIYVEALGQWFWISVYSPAREYFVAVFDVITERKRNENALLASEERHRSILLTAMDGFWLMDTQGCLLEVNDSYCRMSGYCTQELLGMCIPALVADKTADDIAARIQKIKVLGEDRFESRHRRKDGSIFDVEVSVQYQPIEGGRLVVFLRDITERKQIEEELQKKNAEIEQFIYTVSHDLRSPLVTVKTFMGYLEEDMVGDNQEQLAQDIQFIHNAADKMKLLLDELLELSRIGRIETSPVNVSLMDVLTEALDALAGDIRERKADIHLPATDLMLFGDRLRLCQIWQNLIENAIKYNREGSIPRIDLGFQHMNGETVFFVKDNGIGIDPYYLGKIFKIFEKLDPKSPGAGLGLSMIQRIIEKCGGRVWVESEGIGSGSCFFFTLPNALLQG